MSFPKAASMAKRLWILTLALALPAAGDTLRDAGYGDGSLIDSNGDYFYPQSDGTYLDTYGNLFIPGDNDTIETGLDNPIADDYLNDPSNSDDWDAESGGDGMTGLTEGGFGQRRRGPEPTQGAPGAPTSYRDLPGMYMDTGSGYLELDAPNDGTGQSDEDTLTRTEGLGGEAAGIGGAEPAGAGIVTGDFNPQGAHYRQSYFGNPTGALPNGLVYPGVPPSFDRRHRPQR